MELPRIKRFKKHHLKDSSAIKSFALGLSLSLSAALICALVVMISQSRPFPIRSVEVSGNHSHVSKLNLYDVMMLELSEGFFGLSVAKLREDICYLPWVKDAMVRRVWPDKLAIEVIEHEPLAVWNDRAIVTMNGALIMPDDVSLVSSLPKFYGPETKEQQLVQEWRKMQAVLDQIDLKITQIELAQRGAWQLTLGENLKVKLGTQEIHSRLDRFIRAYDTVLGNQSEKVDYVDLRYTSGLAVGWKNS